MRHMRQDPYGFRQGFTGRATGVTRAAEAVWLFRARSG